MKKEIWICDRCNKTGKAENASLGYDEADWANVHIKMRRMNRIGIVDKKMFLCKQCTDKFVELLSSFVKIDSKGNEC